MDKQINFPLKNISWVKIGGNALEFIECKSDSEFKEILKESFSKGKSFEILGWGANTLISDNGIDKTVIKNSSNQIDIIGKGNVEITSSDKEDEKELSDSRFVSLKTDGTFRGIEFKDLDYDESDKEIVKVKVSSGLSLPMAINTLINRGLTGLQWFSGIPGQMGAAVYNNIHGGTHLLSEYIDSVDILTPDGIEQTYSNEDMKFKYDESILHTNKGIITAVTLKLRLGDKDKALYTSREWAKRKISQPKNSLGSTFKNISKEDQLRLGFPTPSIGYLVEHKLMMSGYRVGDAQIAPTSNNFIINLGNAKASDYLEIIRKVKKESYEKFGLTLIPEIFFKGFSKDELDGVI